MSGRGNVIGRNPLIPTASPRNIITYNTLDGVHITGSDNVVAGNSIGLDLDGAIASRNRGAGVYMGTVAGGKVIGGTDPLDRNIISGNADGVYADTTSSATTPNRILGNFIGTDHNGTAGAKNLNDGIRLENSAAIIGGTAADAGNIISGNGSFGIELTDAGGTVIQGNRIGPDVSGINALGNAGGGIAINGGRDYIIGGNTKGAGNQVARNGTLGGLLIPADGIRVVSGAQVRVQGNLIGTTPDGGSPLPNPTGINLVDTTDVVIDGSVTGGRQRDLGQRRHGGGGDVWRSRFRPHDRPGEPDRHQLRRNACGRQPVERHRHQMRHQHDDWRRCGNGRQHHRRQSE